MKTKISTFCFVACMLMSMLSYAQTEVQVYGTDGGYTSILVSDQGKIYFTDSLMFVEDGAGSSYDFTIAHLQKVQFVSQHTDMDDYLSVQAPVIYPNPANSVIRIASQSEEQLYVKVCNLAGQEVMNLLVQPNEPINVSRLKAGIYVVNVNEYHLKFCKQ